MAGMEQELTVMHQTVASLFDKQTQLAAILKTLPTGEKYAAVAGEGEALLAALKAWDEAMIQRRSKAYDDVENFPNRFTANYIFLINQTESDLPRVTQPSRDRLAELNAQWVELKARADTFLADGIPALNRKLWEVGVGAIWKE